MFYSLGVWLESFFFVIVLVGAIAVGLKVLLWD